MPRAGRQSLATSVLKPPPSRLARCLFAALLALATGAAWSAGPVTVIDGVDADLAAEVRTAAGDDNLSCDTPRWILSAHARSLATELRTRLRARGRYGPQISTHLTRPDDCWTIRLDVTPGPETHIRSVDVDVQGAGRSDPELAKVLAGHRLAVGQTLDEGRYEDLKTALSRTALERGYFDADFSEARIDVYPDAAAADIVLHFVTGDRYRFGDLDVSMTPMKLGAPLVERMTRWTPGAPYTLGAIQSLRERLISAAYFRDVDVQAEPEARQDGRVPVRAQLKLRPRHEVRGGVGYASDLGPRLHAGYENRYLNRRGQQFSATADLSPVINEERLSLRMPTSGEGDPWLVIDAGHVRERTDTANSRTLSLGVRRVHGGPWNLRMSEFLELSREQYDVSTDSATAVLLMPGVSFSRSERWQAKPLELGWRLEARVRGAAEPVSSTSFLQGQIEVEGAVPLGPEARLVSRLKVGSTWTSQLRDLPSSVRYFAGGDRSIRGYGYDQLGPKGADGQVRGGRHIVVGSVEAEHVVWKNWSAAVFVDGGGVFNDFTEPTYTGVGFGVRWQSPFGPVRIDLAFPLDDQDHAMRLHVGVGSTFR